jgi:hypothetical protein
VALTSQGDLENSVTCTTVAAGRCSGSANRCNHSYWVVTRGHIALGLADRACVNGTAGSPPSWCLQLGEGVCQ